jgi:hypothetical protein
MLNEIFLLIFSIVVFFFLVRDTYLAWFQPKKYVKLLRKYYHFQISLFPFLRKFGYMDEDLALRSNKYALLFLLLFDFVFLFAVLAQVVNKF